MSDRKPTDFPIARGVSPPPRPFRRVESPPTAAIPRSEPIVANPNIAFADGGDKIVVVRPRPSGRGSLLALQIGAVGVLAGFCMAAGWWIFNQRDSLKAAPAPATVSQLVQAAPAKPIAPVAVVAEPPKPAPRSVPPKESTKPVEPKEKPIPPPPAPPRAADKPTTMLTFQKDIQPILQAKCVLCHGDKNKFKGGLDVRSLRSLEKGGDTGPAINHQEPELSPLWDTVSNGQMPPGKNNKLSESEKKKLHDWLTGGAK